MVYIESRKIPNKINYLKSNRDVNWTRKNGHWIKKPPAVDISILLQEAFLFRVYCLGFTPSLGVFSW